ncbi:hypothetical protein [Caudoviricetes sp.]|nr:hypothetical protein [Caudoviricetes sp.]
MPTPGCDHSKIRFIVKDQRLTIIANTSDGVLVFRGRMASPSRWADALGNPRPNP